MRPWRRGMRSGRRPASAFSTRWTGSGRLCVGFHAACESRGHLSRNALPIAASSFREWCFSHAGILGLTDFRDLDVAGVVACFIGGSLCGPLNPVRPQL